MKRVFALLLIVVMCLSLSACKNEGEEETASSADTVVNKSPDETPDDNKTDDPPSASEDDNEKIPDKTEPEPDDNTPDEQQSATDGLFKVTFDFDYDSKFEIKNVQDKVAKPDAERVGYTLDGWYDGNKEWDFSKDAVTSDLTLTAKWTPIKYTVTYNADGAELPADNPTEYTVATETIELKPASKPGKVFAGWEIKNGSKTVTATYIAKGTVGNLTLTPVWDDNYITLGTYKQSASGSSKEAIVWQKLYEKDGKALYITKEIIDAGAYNSVTGAYVKWESCELRKWMNSTFYNIAFTSKDKEAILLSKLSTPGESDGSQTEDYVFALSYEEAGEYMEKYEDRQATATEYAQSQGAAIGEGYGWWWLRTKVNNTKSAMVENIGKRQIVGYDVKTKTIGIRPAIWVDTSKLP